MLWTWTPSPGSPTPLLPPAGTAALPPWAAASVGSCGLCMQRVMSCAAQSGYVSHRRPGRLHACVAWRRPTHKPQPKRYQPYYPSGCALQGCWLLQALCLSAAAAPPLPLLRPAVLWQLLLRCGGARAGWGWQVARAVNQCAPTACAALYQCSTCSLKRLPAAHHCSSLTTNQPLSLHPATCRARAAAPQVPAGRAAAGVPCLPRAAAAHPAAAGGQHHAGGAPAGAGRV